MNRETQLKANILQKRSPKGIRGFRWQKRMFRLYHDRIVYCSIQTDTPLGEIPLICITKIEKHPNNKKNRFNIIMGSFRKFELQSTTTNIASEWIQILKSNIDRFSLNDQLRNLKQQKDKFWKIDINHYQNYDDDEYDSDPNDLYGPSPIVQQQTMHSPTTTKLKSKSSKSSGKRPKSHKKLPQIDQKKQHKRGAQSNKFFGRESKNKYLKNRKKHKSQHEKSNLMKRSTSSHALSDNEDNRRLSVMESTDFDIDKFKIEEELFYNYANNATPPFGQVSIVSSVQNANSLYLLQLINQSNIFYDTSIAVMSRLKHLINPYIITQIERGTHFQTDWCLYNCPSNGSLTNCLHLFRNVSVTSVRILIAEVLCGLEYLHDSNFNFPNLSPETIYISHKSHIILTDFGFAIPNNRKNEIYRSGPLCYAPPEFLLNGVDDIKSDWWRLGVLIYHLIYGKPPFMGDRQSVCHQICDDNFIICDENLFNHNANIQIDDVTKDLILGLLTRDRKKRYGCNSKKRPMANRLFGIDEIMQHSFFECINNKKNKDYAFTWNDIRKRQHMAAPILRHLSTRRTESPRYSIQNELKEDHANDDNNEQNKIENAKNVQRETSKNSLVDTTDDEEYGMSEEEEEKSFNQPSKGTGNITPNRSSPENNFGTLSGTMSKSNSYNPSPLNHSGSFGASPPIHMNASSLSSNGNNAAFVYPNNNNNNNASLHPLQQSPPPIATHNSHSNDNEFSYDRNGTPISNNIQSPTPMIANNNNKKKERKENRPRHRKQLSSKMEIIPTRALPPPPSSNGKKISPRLPQSELNENLGTPDAKDEHDRFAKYVQHQQSQMQMVDVPRLNNLHDLDDKKPETDASTMVSDQIAAAAALRQPILTEKQRIKQQEKDFKKLQKKAKRKSKKNSSNNIDNIPQPVKKKMHKPKNLPQPPNGPKPKKKIGNIFTKKIQAKVSKKKRRFVDKVNGFNLDLTYITKRIIAMGFPSEGNEAMYRNPCSEVKRFFNTYHPQKFKVYNLCIEKDRQYPLDKFADVGGKCAKFGFKDHNAPQLELILAFCQDLHEWLAKDKGNIAAIHCKAGKGRTGVMICAYLAYSKICKNAQESLLKYGQARTKNAKGVTIPSQRRYVLYFADYVMNPSLTPNPSQFDFYKVCILKRVQMNSIPDFDIGGGCDPYFVILNVSGEVLYDYSQHNPVKPQRSKHSKKKRKKGKKKSEILPSAQQNHEIDDDDFVRFRDVDIILRGAFKIVFYDKDVLSSDDIMCWCWLHSSISSSEKHIVLERDEVDGAVKDTAYKHFANNFCLEFWFETPKNIEIEKENELNLGDWISEKSQNEWKNAHSPKQQSSEKRRKRKKNHRAATAKPLMRNYQSGPIENNYYEHQQQNGVSYPPQQQQQQHNVHRDGKRKKLQRTVSRPVMRNIKSANSPSSPSYDNNLDVLGDDDYEEHMRKQQQRSFQKPKIKNVHSVGSNHSFEPIHEQQSPPHRQQSPHQNVMPSHHYHTMHAPPKRKKKKKNNRATSKPMLRNHQSTGLAPTQKLKKRYSNPNASQIHSVQQQQRMNNAYNPVNIRLNTYNQQQQQQQQHSQQQYSNNRYQGQYHDNHHYHNGNAVQPITVNSSMMNTLRQNMKHHLSPTSDDDDDWTSNRKSTLV